MNIHKRTRLTPLQRKELATDYGVYHIPIRELGRKYSVSPPTVYKIIKNARMKDFSIHRSVNKRYRCLEYGLKRLEKVERELEEKLKKQARRYNKQYPGEMVHMDTKRLPLLKGESPKDSHEYLFVGIDDFSRELFVAIKSDKTQSSSSAFLRQVIEEAPYTIEQIYTDNGTEYKGTKEHAFSIECAANKIEQRFTKVKHPQTNGKAERVIRTIMQMWHEKTVFVSRAHRRTELIRFVNWYNTVKPHASLDNLTPQEQLLSYFYPEKL